jgi:hypothetical protein
MKFFKYIALAVLASTISANAVSTQTVGNLKRTDTVVTAVDDLVSDTELATALGSYATKAWAATTATNAANHAAGSKVTKVTGAQSGHVVKFASGGEVADSGLAVDDLLTAADLDDYALKADFTVTTNTANKTVTIKLGSAGKTTTAIYQHQDISGKANMAVPTAANNLAALTATGDLADSGIAKTTVATKTEVGGKVSKTSAISKLDNNSTIDDVYTTVNAIIDALNQ